MHIERRQETKIVRWSGSTSSQAIRLAPAAGWNLYLPSTFAGTSLTVQCHIVIPDENVDAWVQYEVSALSVTANRVVDLTALNLFGLDEIRLVSDATETCVGQLLMAS